MPILNAINTCLLCCLFVSCCCYCWCFAVLFVCSLNTMCVFVVKPCCSPFVLQKTPLLYYAIMQHFSDCDGGAIFRISSNKFVICTKSYQNRRRFDLFRTSSKFWRTDTNKKKGGGRMSSGCSQKLQKGGCSQEWFFAPSPRTFLWLISGCRILATYY
jgi:hypothetical protein